LVSRIDILTPATIDVLAGDAAVSSLDALPPYGIEITDPSGGTFAVTLIAAAAAGLTASGVAGATIAANADTLTVTGNQAQVDAALASLEITETSSGADRLSITVSDSLALSARSTVAIASLPTLGPAFVAPPLAFTLAPEALDAIGGLVLSDPLESAFAAMGYGTGISLSGAGQEGTLRVILTVGNGVLLLPGFSPSGGITASGLGTGSLALTCDANELAALNALLAGLDYVGPAGEDELEYSAQDLLNGQAFDGTFGRIFLRLKGNAGTAETLVAGTQTLGLGGASLGGALGVTGTLVMQSTSAASVTLAVAPAASLEVSATSLTLAGTSLDEGALSAAALAVAGTLLIADGMDFANAAAIGTAGHVLATGLIDLLASETLAGAVALSLAAGATFEGDGTLLLGNAGAAGAIAGPGTILAGAGETLLIAGGSVGGGALLEVADGGVLVLGPVDPLYGIFNGTPLTIDSSVTLAFADNIGALPITGGYADTLGGPGGAFVISGAEAFAGTVTGFMPGDALIFPDIDNLTVFNPSPSRFSVDGTDESGSTVTYTIIATTPAGMTPAIAYDEAGDPEVVLRSAATITVPEVYQATNGTAQPLQGLALELNQASTLSFALTLAAQHGTLSEGTLAGAKITLSAANLTGINELLGQVSYTGTASGNGTNDNVTITSNSDDIGLDAVVPIENAAGGSVSAYSGLAFTEGQSAAFAVSAGLYEQSTPVAAGAAVVTGTVAFEALMQDNGLSSTSLLIDAGGDAIFGDAAAVSLGAGATIGDAGGAGSIAILGTDFIEAGNFVLAASALGAGSTAALLGDLTIAGSLGIGTAGRAAMTVLGTLDGQGASLGASGTLLADGSAALSLTTLTDAGTLVLANAASLALASLAVTGHASIGGAAAVAASGQVALAAGASLGLAIDATLDAASFTDAGTAQIGGQLSLAGTLALGGPLSLAGGTILAAALIDTGTLSGAGIVVAPTIANDADLFVVGGTMALAGGFTNSGVVYIETTGTLDLIGSAGGAPLDFRGTDAALIVNDPYDFTAGVAALLAGDAVDLVGVAPSLVTFAAGEVTIANSVGQALATFALDQPSTSGVSIVSDGAGGAEITIGGQLPCFARGTRLLTPQGYRPVETLRPGDPVVTASGAKRPVRWLGWRTLDFRGNRHAAAQPVLIEAGAFADGVPARPVVLSPQHAVCLHGVLVPVGHLVNGVTLRRLPLRVLTYYHVELDRHDALLAEGLACESYFDDGNRGGLYRELGRRHPAARPMAPYLTAGAPVTALRRHLHERILSAGYTPTFSPRLSVIADGMQAAVECADDVSIRLPRPARRLTLISPAQAAAETDPNADDWRPLSLCWAPADYFRFGAGFHAPAAGDRGRWMGAKGEIELSAPLSAVTLRVTAVARRWEKVKDQA
jgi:hypothetical protein